MTSTYDLGDGTVIPTSAAAEILRVDLVANTLILENLNGRDETEDPTTVLSRRIVDEEHDPVWFLSLLAASLAEKCADAMPSMAGDWLQGEIKGTTEYLGMILGATV